MVWIAKILLTPAKKNCGFIAFLLFLLTLFNTSCSENSQWPKDNTSTLDENKSQKETSSDLKKIMNKNNSVKECTYFYPIVDSARIYCYRNITNGLDEEFHRVFTLEDSIKHLIVERFSASKRFLEGINYDLESKKVLEHVIVNRNNEREIAKIKSSQLFPMDQSTVNTFVSEFSGMNDSVIFRKENHRRYFKTQKTSYQKTKSLKTFIFKDSIEQHSINVFSNKGRKIGAIAFIHFVEGIGPFEWYDENKKIHFKLEKIISQKEWIRLMQF